MADNITVTGAVLASDDIGGVQYPRTKLSIGADGAAADVHAGNPLPADINASLRSSTATRTAVASGTSSATILASNANRKGGVIYNSDANALLLDLSGGTASATRHQVRLLQYQSYAVEAGYSGAITGIWEADGSGQADVVEFT